jgi:hypothetical protein
MKMEEQSRHAYDCLMEAAAIFTWRSVGGGKTETFLSIFGYINWNYCRGSTGGDSINYETLQKAMSISTEGLPFLLAEETFELFRCTSVSSVNTLMSVSDWQPLTSIASSKDLSLVIMRSTEDDAFNKDVTQKFRQFSASSINRLPQFIFNYFNI